MIINNFYHLSINKMTFVVIAHTPTKEAFIHLSFVCYTRLVVLLVKVELDGYPATKKNLTV
jgi:hypothetical protein